MNLKNGLPNIPPPSFDNFDHEIYTLKKELDEINLNITTNYSNILDNVLDFKNQLDSYSNQIKNIEYRITFVINLDNENDAVKRLLPDLKKSIESAKNQINLLLRMYDLKKLTTIRKTK